VNRQTPTALVVAVLAAFWGASTTLRGNSCSNVNVPGTYDQSGLREGDSWIAAAGTLRIAGEEIEKWQPMFNLTQVHCSRQVDDGDSFKCDVTKALVLASSENPNSEDPNCSLDLDVSEYQMKELQTGFLSGMEPLGSTTCFDSVLTIDRNTKRV